MPRVLIPGHFKLTPYFLFLQPQNPIVLLPTSSPERPLESPAWLAPCINTRAARANLRQRCRGMSPFSQLSTELVLSILEKVYPEDLVSFSITCKDIYHLSIARLKEHRLLIHQYQKISNGIQYKPCRWQGWRRQVGVLRELLFSFHKDPVVARYVRSIEAVAWLPEFADYTVLPGSNLPSRGYSEDQMKLFRELIPSDILSVTDREAWYNILQLGDEDVTLALVLLHTPNLESLTIIDPVRIPSCVLKIACLAAQDGRLGTILTSLRYLHLRCCHRIESLHLLRSFMLIPSLTSIRVDGLGSQFEHCPNPINQVSNPLPQGRSNVNTIRFHGGYMGTNAIFELLGSALKMEHFEYCFHYWKDREVFDGQAITDGLLVRSQHVLKSLNVRFSGTVRQKGSGWIKAEDLAQSKPMDLSCFTSLEIIGLSAEMLFEPDSKKVTHLQEQLPASIRPLSIEYGIEKPLCYARDSLVNLETPSRKRLPHLRELQIHIAHYPGAAQIAEYMEVRSNQGLSVEYSIHAASFGITFHPTIIDSVSCLSVSPCTRFDHRRDASSAPGVCLHDAIDSFDCCGSFLSQGSCTCSECADSEEEV